jgi:hypothetical protein
MRNGARFNHVIPWPIVLWIAAGTILARIALAYAAPHYPVDLAQPLTVATNWGIYGAAVCGALAVAVIGAGRTYLRAIACPPRLRVTLAVATLALLAGSLWSPLLSSDVYAYAAYGEMARLHLDPYVHHALRDDAIVRAAEWQWSGSLPICVYGEAFVALSRAIVTALHQAEIVVTLNAFRVLASLSLLACAAFAYLAAGDVQRGRRAAAFIALNPVVLYVALEGHNDVLAIACVLAGVALARRFPAAGTALAAAAGAIKAPAVAAGAAIVLQRIVQRRAWLAAAAGACVGAVVTLASSLQLLAGVRTTLAPHGVYLPFASVQAVSPLVAAAVALAVLSRLRTAAREADRWTLLALCAWLAIPNPYPWYAVWLIAVAAFAEDTRVIITALTVAAVSVLRYLPDAAGPPVPAEAIAIGVAALVAYLPLTRTADAHGIITSS